jgi:lysyl-tRNA synthetase class II
MKPAIRFTLEDGIGIDRPVLLGQESIRDVILFPQLKPK